MRDRPRIRGSWSVWPGHCPQRPARALTFLILVGLIGTTASRTGAQAVPDDPKASLPPPAPFVKPVIDGQTWPCWRGPGGDGIRAEPLPGPHWSATHGVLWKAAVPGQGHASPVVVGDRVLVSTADERAQNRSLLCYHRQTGALTWKVVLHAGAFMAKHEKNSHASPTPACDSRRAYVPYLADDALWLSAVDLGGRIAWQSRIGSFVSQYGYASSPVLDKDLVIVAGENRGAPGGPATPETSYLAGVSRDSGAVVWRVSRPTAPSYGTPVVARLAGRDQLLLSGAGGITAFDPATGKELWSCRWPAPRSASSPAWGNDCVYASTTWPEAETLCVRADGSGDVTASHLGWRQPRGAADVPAPLYHDGRLYLVNDRGMATCLDGATGRVLWQQRLGAAFSASPVLAGDAILATDEEGTTHVFKAAATFQRLATNPLNDPVLASPALSGDRLFLRSQQFLWCLQGQTAADPVATRPPEVDLRVRSGSPAPAAARSPPPAAAKGPLPAADEPGKGGLKPWLMAAGVAGLVLTLTGLVWLVASRHRPGNRARPAPARDEQPGVKPAAPVVSFVCSACRKKLRVRAQLAGKTVKCPACGTAVLARPSLASPG
jgi:outer membrane protein assembly factor BamB